MPDNKLKEIGDKLEILDEDIRKIKEEKHKSRFLYPITGGIIAICSTLLGYLAGKSVEPRMEYKGYPYGQHMGFNAILCFAIPALGIGSIISALIFRFDPEHNKSKRSIGINIIALIIGGIAVYTLGYIFLFGFHYLITAGFPGVLSITNPPAYAANPGEYITSREYTTFTIFAILILGIVSVLFLKLGVKHNKSKRSTLVAILMTVITSIVGFIIAYELFKPVSYYSEGIMYNVFSKAKEKNKNNLKN